jgi:glucose-6-phosphate dehydrogenase assembly protein OpcA
MTTNTLLGGQTHINIRAIEQELTELWKSAAQGEGEGEQRGMVTRACTLNLIVVTHGNAASNAVTEVLASLTGTHPHRAIVVTLEDSSEPAETPIDAWVQAHCQIPVPGRPQVCCEQISITARGEGVGRVPGTILPLLVPDVPVALWYPEGEPFGDPLFERLTELADRVIVDTERFVDPEGGLRRLAGLIGRIPPAGDLAWDRLTLWRELVAQCFDSPALTGQLSQLERVRIVYGAQCSRVPPLMLAGWFAARLGWRFLGRSGPTEATRLRMQRQDGEVLIELRRGPLGMAAANHLTSVELSSPSLRVTIAPKGHDHSLLTTIQPAGRPALLRSATGQYPAIAELLATEIRLLSRDKTYEAVLFAAAGMI